MARYLLASGGPSPVCELPDNGDPIPNDPPTYNGQAPDETINVGDDPQQKVNDAGVGGIVAIGPGIHTNWNNVRLLKDQVLIAYRDAVIRGSRSLSNWVSSNGRYYHNGITEQSFGAKENWRPDVREANGSTPIHYNDSRNAWRGEMLIFEKPDGTKIHGRHRNSLNDVDNPEDYWIDYSAKRVYTKSINEFSDIRLTSKEFAIILNAAGTENENNKVSGVKIIGYHPDAKLVIEEYSARWHGGAIMTEAEHTSEKTELKYLLCRHNHGAGVTLRGKDIHIHWCDFIENAQIGVLVSQSEKLEFNHNRLINNNPQDRLGIKGWETGGIKWTRGRYQEIHHNYGTGNSQNTFWSDVDNGEPADSGGEDDTAAKVHHNLAELGQGRGFFHEHSDGCKIYNNYSRLNCRYFVGINKSPVAHTGQPAEIFVWAASGGSKPVEIYNNVIEVDNIPGVKIGACGISAYVTSREKNTDNVTISGNRIVYNARYDKSADGSKKPRSGTFAKKVKPEDQAATEERIASMNASYSSENNKYYGIVAPGDDENDYKAWWESMGPNIHEERSLSEAQSRKVPKFPNDPDPDLAPWESGSTFIGRSSSAELPFIDRSLLKVDKYNLPTWVDILQETTINLP